MWTSQCDLCLTPQSVTSCTWTNFYTSHGLFTFGANANANTRRESFHHRCAGVCWRRSHEPELQVRAALLSRSSILRCRVDDSTVHTTRWVACIPVGTVHARESEHARGLGAAQVEGVRLRSNEPRFVCLFGCGRASLRFAPTVWAHVNMTSHAPVSGRSSWKHDAALHLSEHKLVLLTLCCSLRSCWVTVTLKGLRTFYYFILFYFSFQKE